MTDRPAPLCAVVVVTRRGLDPRARAAYSTFELVTKQCTRTPDAQWSQTYGTSGGMDYGLATRDWRDGASSTTAVYCRVDNDNCFSSSNPGGRCAYTNFITMNYGRNPSNAYYDICVRDLTCSTTRNVVLLLG